MSSLSALVSIVCAALLWGSVGLFVRRLAATGMSSLDIVTLRLVIASMGAILLWRSTPGKAPWRRRDLAFLVAYGAWTAVVLTVFIITVQRIPLGLASVLQNTAPLWVLAGAVALARERLTAAKCLGLVISLGGVAMIAAGRWGGGIDGAGLGLGLLAGLSYGGLTLFAKEAVTRMPPLQAYAASSTVAAVLLASLDAIRVAGWPGWLSSLTPTAWLTALALGVGPTLLAYWLYLMALRHLEASQASLAATVEPLGAGAYGWWLLGEHLSWGQLLGGVLVLAGARWAGSGQAKEGESVHVRVRRTFNDLGRGRRPWPRRRPA